jgi:hypothetical protein
MTFKVKVLMKNGIKLKLLFFYNNKLHTKNKQTKKAISIEKKKLKFNQL